MKQKITNLKNKIMSFDYKLYCKDNILFLTFVISSIINGLLIRALTVKNILDIRPIIADEAMVIIIGAFGYLIKPKKRYIYYLIWGIIYSIICVINSMYYTNYLSFSSISLIATSFIIVDVGDELVENIISYIASKVHNLTVVNLSQYLWFIDALSFQQRGVSITGLVYEKKQKNLFIIEKKHIEISLLNNKYFINDKSFNLISKENYDLTKLKPDEIGIIKNVINILKNKETAEILSILYKEESWKNTEENNEISFEYMLDKRI